MERNELVRRLEAARTDFLTNERSLLTIGAHEQTLTSKFAQYLQVRFDEWDVDCEYDRLLTSLKRLAWRDPEHGGRGEAVRPDIIVHKRKQKVNLLVVEAKKSNAADGADRKKLAAFKRNEDFRYEYAAVLRFTMGRNANAQLEIV